jgi:proteasome lid subunit RPN8/RPN11
MPVYRRTPLPTGPAIGRLLLAEQVVAPTRAALQASSGQHLNHEGLVFWLGRTVDDDTLVDEVAVAATTRAAHAAGLGLVGQVHSHPGHDTRHSDGDDQLILMPFDGMFSLVVADYGHGSLLPEQGAGLHQRQNSRWVQISSDCLRVIPAAVGIGAVR